MNERAKKEKNTLKVYQLSPSNRKAPTSEALKINWDVGIAKESWLGIGLPL